MEEAPLEELVHPSLRPLPRPIKLFTDREEGREGGGGLTVKSSLTSLLKYILMRGSLGIFCVDYILTLG